MQRGCGNLYHNRCSGSLSAFLLRHTFFTSPTISDVWTTSFLTHSVKIKAPQIFLDFMERISGWYLGLQKIWKPRAGKISGYKTSAWFMKCLPFRISQHHSLYRLARYEVVQRRSIVQLMTETGRLCSGRCDRRGCCQTPNLGPIECGMATEGFESPGQHLLTEWTSKSD